MTQAAWLLLALAAAVAVIDWIGVVHEHRRLRWVTKPAVMLLLVGVALALQPASPSQRAIFVAALFLSLLGDVFLLPSAEGWFMAGLAAFLGAHLAFIDGFLVGGIERNLLPYSAVAVGIASVAVGGPVLRALLAGGRRGLAGPVVLYLLVISVMLAVAGASGRPVAVAGAALFYASDGLIAWTRFVRPLRWAALPIMASYHAGQALLVLSLSG
jgi:uncharacterized membrane protein YhhN